MKAQVPVCFTLHFSAAQPKLVRMTLGIIVTQIMCTCVSRSQQPFGNCCHGLGLQSHQVGWQPDGIHACVSPCGKYIAFSGV